MSTDTLIPSDFPNPHRLGGTELFRCILGDMAKSTFFRKLAEEKLPVPVRVGHLHKWPETVMAATRDAGVA